MSHRKSAFSMRRRLPLLAVWTVTPFLLLANSCPPPPTVDRPAADLDVKITVIDTNASPSDGKVPVFAQFFLDGKFVKVSASVSCNGVALSDHGLGYAERIPMVAPGGFYTVTYSRGAATTTASVRVPSRPVFTSPAAGASVPRSASLTITYVAGSGSGIRGSAGDGSTGLGGNRQSDTGTYTGFNVSTLNAGSGSLGLTREFELTISGTGFKSAESDYSSGSDIDVTWL